MYTPSTEKLTDLGPHYRRTKRDGTPRDPLTVDKYVCLMDCGTEIIPVEIIQGHMTREHTPVPMTDDRKQSYLDARAQGQSWANVIGTETDWTCTIYRGARPALSPAAASY